MRNQKLSTSRKARARQAATGRNAFLALAALSLAGCSTLGASGPPTGAIKRVNGGSVDIKLVELTDDVAVRRSTMDKKRSFAQVFGDQAADYSVIGKGDTIDISLWESPPAVLFGVISADNRLTSPSLGQGASLPQQMVDNEGRISVPFAGSLNVVGRTTRQVERDILARLAGKAHDAQVVVRLVQNEARTVTIVGEFVATRRLPLTPRGERVLDAIAAAGGTKQPVGKTTIQLSRGNVFAMMSLDGLIRDPSQNVRLQPGDVVTGLFQPFSFTALGASNLNAEVPFESNGLTLVQALGRIGGLRDERADIHGVFIFRFEDKNALDPSLVVGAPVTPDGRVPVIYRLNLSDPASLFASQRFLIEDKDVIYISNAPGVDLLKFTNIVTSLSFSAINLGNAVR